MQRNIIIFAILGALTAGTCKPISIFGGKNKKSIFGHIGDTFQRGVKGVSSAAFPDVSIKWDSDNRSEVIYDIESRLNNNIHTAASNLKGVVSDMNTKLAGNVDRAHTHLKDIAHELDTVMHNSADYAKSHFAQLIVQVNDIIQAHRDKLDDQVDNIESRFQHIVDTAVDTSVRKGAYALTGATCTTLGLYMLTQMALYPEQRNTGTYIATPACLIAGLAVIENSHALGNNGFIHYLSPSTYTNYCDEADSDDA